MASRRQTSLTFGIIGYGRFGKLWAQCLKPFGKVKISDKNQRTVHPSMKSPPFVSLSDIVNVDILFLLVPISQIENVCRKIAPLLKPHTLVVDACSVKVAPVKTMKKWLTKDQAVIATHPLFGPDSIKRLGLAGQKIVVCNVRASKTQLASLEKIFKKLRLRIIRATPEEHDRQMAKSQALVHFIGRGLEPLKLNPQAISTPDYLTLLRMNDMVNNDTQELFFDMQNSNPYTEKIRKTFLKSLQRLDHEISKKR